jgi:hypothetical protein
VLVVLDLLWRTPQVFENLAWNASFPILFLVASVAFGWLVAGTVVGLGCWLAPVIQQLADPVGNVSAVLHANTGQSTLGVSFALRDLAIAGALHPIWLTHVPAGFYSLAGLETAYPAAYGVAVLATLAAISVVGLARRRPLGALAAVTLAVSVGLVVSLTVFPSKNILSLGYLVDAFWVVGAALWLVAGWTVVELARAAVRRRGQLPALARVGRVAAPWTVLAVLAAFVAVGALDIGAAGASRTTSGWTSSDVALVDRATGPRARRRARRDRDHRGRPDFFGRTWTEEGIVYRLEVQGWQPGTSGRVLHDTGLRAPRDSPTYVVAIRGTSLVGITRLT